MATLATHPKMTDVAIVGASLFGLTIAAHLQARGIGFRIFDEPMKFWREMPPNMFLKSFAGYANIDAPEASYTFSEYSKDRGLEAEEPCAIRDFADYGLFMQQRVAPELEPAAVTKLTYLHEAHHDVPWDEPALVRLGMRRVLERRLANKVKDLTKALTRKRAQRSH